MQGTLKRWNDERGYGFIIPDDGLADVFLHASELPLEHDSLPRGTELGFDIETRPDGKRAATNVNVIKIGIPAPTESAAPMRSSTMAPRSAPRPAPAPQGKAPERNGLWTREQRSELAKHVGDELLSLARSPTVEDGSNRVAAARLLLEALSEDARESYPD